MKVLSVVMAFLLFSSVLGVASAFEVQERSHQLGEMFGVPCGFCCFACPPWALRACALVSCFQAVISDICALFISTVVRYVSLYIIPMIYDLVDTVLPLTPERSFGYIVLVLSCLKG
jgi:hypothetical protein